MDKAEALKAELAKLGIHTEEQLKEAIKKMGLNISLMVGEVPKAERLVS